MARCRLSSAEAAKRDDMIVRLWNDGVDTALIAHKTGLVRVACRIAELRKRRDDIVWRNTSGTTVAWSDERLAKLKELCEAGLSAGEIADQLGGVSRNAVIGHIHRRGWKLSGARKLPLTDWTPDLVERVRVLFMSGASYRELGEATGVSPSACRRKIERSGWVSTRPPFKRPSGGGSKPGRTYHRPERSRVSVSTFAPDATWLPIEGSEPKPWTERRPDECCWPVGGEGADTLSCCRPVHGKGWCIEHFSLGTVANTAYRPTVRPAGNYRWAMALAAE